MRLLSRVHATRIERGAQAGHHPRRSFWLAAGLLAVTAPSQAQLVADAWESAPGVNAGRLLSPEQLQSSAHRLRDAVGVDVSGNLLVFTLESDYGSFEITSEILLRERVHEVQVLAQAIGQFRRADEPLAQRLRGQLEVSADSWVDIVTSPFDTSGQLLEQLASNVGQTVQEFGEFPDAPTESSRLARPSPRADTALASYRRNIASQVGLDPYSSNPRVQAFLESLAEARAGGSTATSALSVRVAGTGVRRVAGGSIDAAVRYALTRTEPQALEEAVAQTLRQRDVPPSVVAGFLSNPALSMRHRTVITAHLDFMNDVGGAVNVVDAARTASDEVAALAFEVVTRMLALYHEGEAPLARIADGGALPVAHTRAGALVWALPVDQLYWNEPLERAAGALTANAGERTVVLLVPGIVSERALAKLGERGIIVRERFLYRP